MSTVNQRELHTTSFLPGSFAAS